MAGSKTGKTYALDGPLYNGAVDGDGGTWIRIASKTDHRILLSAVKKQLKNHEAAGNTVGALDEEAVEKLDYIKESLERIKSSVIGALPASEQLAGTPIGKAIEEQLKIEHPDELAPSSEVEIEDNSLLVELKDVGADVVAIPETWTNDDRKAVYRWTRAIKLTQGGARRDLHVPTRPACVPVDWFSQDIKAAIERGQIDEESHAPIVLDEAQTNYWLAQGPWRIAEYTVENELQPPNGLTIIEFAIEWSEAPEKDVQTPTHPYVYDTREKARDVAARMNRRVRTSSVTEADEAIVQGEPLSLNESLLTEELQKAVIKDMNDHLRAQGDSKTFIDKEPLNVGALRKWYRSGPYTAQAIDEAKGRYRVVKEIEAGRSVGTLDDFDIFEATVRAALWNRAEFQTGQLWGEPNEAEQAVTEGKKKAQRKKGRGKKK